VYFKKLKRLK